MKPELTLEILDTLVAQIRDPLRDYDHVIVETDDEFLLLPPAMGIDDEARQVQHYLPLGQMDALAKIASGEAEWGDSKTVTTFLDIPILRSDYIEEDNG